MTGRPPLEIGENGEVTIRPNGRGGFKARTRVRDQDGKVRDVTATGATRREANLALRGRLDTRSAPSAAGITAAMTLEEAAEFFLRHRARTGLVRTKGPVKPQTLAAYNDALSRVVLPAMGGVRIREMRVGRLDAILGDLEESGQSTAQARSVLTQILGLAVRHEALATNPMTFVAPMQREHREVEVLAPAQVTLLRHVVLPTTTRQPGKRGPNGDLRDVVDGLLGTGCRIGELLALNWRHVDLESKVPTAAITGTLVEPRAGYVDKLHRQESTKSKESRVLVLPDPVVEMLWARRERSRHIKADDAVFGSRNGTYLWPNNIRTRLRTAVAGHPGLVRTTPHTLRRTIGTLIAHEVSLDAARQQLGHSDPGVTGQRYVAPRPVAPDLRVLLQTMFDPVG